MFSLNATRAIFSAVSICFQFAIVWFSSFSMNMMIFSMCVPPLIVMAFFSVQPIIVFAMVSALFPALNIWYHVFGATKKFHSLSWTLYMQIASFNYVFDKLIFEKVVMMVCKK